MTASEDQPQPIVVDTAFVALLWFVRFVFVRLRRHGYGLLQLGSASGKTAQPIECPVASRRGQPRSRIARDAIAPPSIERLRKGVLRAFLCYIPVASHPDQSRNNPTPFLAKCLGDGSLDVARHISQIGLTSIDP
jgi:hypothetical protein